MEGRRVRGWGEKIDALKEGEEERVNLLYAFQFITS